MPSAIVRPSLPQSLWTNAIRIRLAHSLIASMTGELSRSAAKSGRRPEVSSPPRPPPPPPPEPPPEPPDPAEFVSFANWLSSSNGNTVSCFFNSLAAFPAFPRPSEAPPAPLPRSPTASAESSIEPNMSSAYPLAAASGLPNRVHINVRNALAA